MQNRFNYLDILRLFSVLLVMFGHYVLVAGGALDIPGIINPNLTHLPIIDNGLWGLWKFEIFLIEKFSTQTAILGVSIFLLMQMTNTIWGFNKVPKVVLSISDLVYPIYLVHVAIGLCTMVFVRNMTSNPYLMICSAMLLTLICSYILHVIIEHPSIRLGRSFMNKFLRIKGI